MFLGKAKKISHYTRLHTYSAAARGEHCVHLLQQCCLLLLLLLLLEAQSALAKTRLFECLALRWEPPGGLALRWEPPGDDLDARGMSKKTKRGLV